MNKHLLHIISLLIILLNLNSCKKSDDRSCIKSFGDPVSKIIQFDKIDTLELYDDIQLNLIQDNSNYLEIKDFKNTINFIESNFTNNNLTLSNNNKCKVLRSRKKHPEINLHFDTIHKLKLFGGGALTTYSSWNQDSINIFSEESSSILNLEIKSNDINMYFKNGEIVGSIYGSSANVYCYQGKYTNLDLKSLITPHIHFASATTGDVNVYCSDFLHIELWDTGNVIYYGDPDSIYISEDHLTGKLIKGD